MGPRVVPPGAGPALRTRVRRALWRRARRVWFLVAQRHRYDRFVVERVAGREIVVLPGVFNPKLLRTGEILAEAVADATPPGGRVLDLGTGSGVVAVFAATLAESVVAVDLNPAALRSLRLNVVVHRLQGRVEARHGDLFDAVPGETFDLVAFNPPYLEGDPRDDRERAFRSGDVLERFAAGLADHLAPGARALVVLSTDGRGDDLLDLLAERGFLLEPTISRDLRSEVVTVWAVTAGDG